MNKIGLIGSFTVLLLAIYSCQGQDGQRYGAVCNGILNQCNRYSETVLCMNRKGNLTGEDTCEVGLSIDVGRCQCRRNCGADGLYVIDGEFHEGMQKCVGFVGKNCKLYPDCTLNAHCHPVTRICECNEGYVPTSDGLKCVAA